MTGGCFGGLVGVIFLGKIARQSVGSEGGIEDQIAAGLRSRD